MKKSFAAIAWAMLVCAMALGQNQTSTGQVGPRGYTGARGPAGNIAIGTVTAGDPGSAPSFVNVGTASSAVINITIPRGSAIFSGAGTPAASVGGNQDYYILTTGTPCLYGPKSTGAGGAWPSTCISLGGGGSGSGGVTPSTIRQKPYYDTASTVRGDTGATTDGAGNETLVSLNAFNSAKFAPITISSALSVFNRDYQTGCWSDGTHCGGNSEPYSLYNDMTMRFGGHFGQNAQAALNMQNIAWSGGENDYNLLENFQTFGLVDKYYTPGQGGGQFFQSIDQITNGDGVMHTTDIRWWGCNRGFDECGELERDFASFNAADFGGTVALGTVRPSGHIPMNITPFGGYSVGKPGEQNLLVDVTKRHQLGNMIGSAATDSGAFVTVQLDAAHSFNPSSSTSTTLLSAVDSQLYSGTCPSVTATGALFPLAGPQLNTGDAWSTPPDGEGRQNINGNINTTTGALQGFCFHVGSTAGMSTGSLINIAHMNNDQEFTKVLSVVDSTHFTAFVHHNHDVGTTIAWNTASGGGIGWAYGMNADERAAGFGSIYNVRQNAILRTVFPIVKVPDSTHLTLFVDSEQVAELRTLAFRTNKPKIKAVLSATVTGGVVTGVGVASNDYGADVGVGQAPGGTDRLPPPPITFTGSGSCTTNPVLSWSLINNTNQLQYNPSLVSGGTGCPSDFAFVVGTTPNPAYVMPVTQLYRNLDTTGPTLNIGQGYIVAQAIDSSQWSNGDEVATTMWTGRWSGSQRHYSGDPIVGVSGRFGVADIDEYRFVQSGQTYHWVVNTTPANWYIGTLANNWTPSNSFEGRYNPGHVFGFGGIQNGLYFALPPIAGLASNRLAGGPANAPPIGGSLLTVDCFAGNESIDHPCEHSIHPLYRIWEDKISNDALVVNEENHSLSFVSSLGAPTTFFANTLSTNSFSTIDLSLSGNLSLNGTGKGISTDLVLLGNTFLGGTSASGGFTPLQINGNNSFGVNIQFMNQNYGDVFYAGYIGPSGENGTGAHSFGIVNSTEGPELTLGNHRAEFGVNNTGELTYMVSSPNYEVWHNLNMFVSFLSPPAILNYSTHTGADAYFFNGGAGQRLGIGTNIGNYQFFTSGSAVISWNSGGDLQALGTNEMMRLCGSGILNVGNQNCTSGKLLEVGSSGQFAVDSSGNIVAGNTTVGALKINTAAAGTGVGTATKSIPVTDSTGTTYYIPLSTTP